MLRVVDPVVRPVLRSVVGARRGGGSSDPVFPEKDFYFNDFTGIADSTKLRDLPGWAAYSSTGATTAERDKWQIKSSAATRVSGSEDYDITPGKFVIGYNTGSTDHLIRMKLVAIPSAGQEINIIIAGTDNKNCVFINCVNSGGVMQDVSATKIVAGVHTGLSGGVPRPLGLGRPIQAGDILDIRSIGQRVHLYINEIQISPASGWDMDKTAPFVKGNIVGVGTRGNVAALFDDIYIATSTSVMSINDPAVFVPGSIILGGRTTAVSGTYSGTVEAIDYRVVNAATGAVVKPWARVAVPSIVGNLWAANVFVPMCDTTVNPKIKIQVRASNDIDAMALSTTTCVGLTVGSYGQSNSAYRGTGFATTYAVAHAYTWSSDASGVWQGGGTSTELRSQRWASKLAEITGVPCGVLVLGKGSASILNLTTVDWVAEALDKATSAKAAGYVASWLWTQGESEAGGTYGVNVAEYRGHFDNLLGLLGGISITPTPSVGICIIGKTTGGHVAGNTAGDLHWSKQRENLFNLTDKPNVYVATNLSDAAMTDTLHYTADAYVENGRRAALSMGKALGYGGYDGRGPLVTGATRSGAVVTLAIDLNGASSIAGTGLTHYQVSADNFATLLTVSSAAVSGGNIALTLSADPGAAVKVRSFYGMDWTSPVRAIGTYADGTTIPVEPIFDAITAT